MQVLKKVMQHEIAESFFNEPVDPDALGIPEYREIIRVRQTGLCSSLADDNPDACAVIPFFFTMPLVHHPRPAY